jgi:hypothetical protein
MTRRLLNLLTLLSLLLCVAVAALWVRSYWRFDRLTRCEGRRSDGDYVQTNVHVALGRGSLYLDRFRICSEKPTLFVAGTVWNRFTDSESAGRSDYENLKWDSRWAGFRLFRNSLTPAESGGLDMSMDVTVVGIPLWALAVLTGVAPARWIYTRSRCRHTISTCSQCGYDLRATPDRCPECGAVS